MFYHYTFAHIGNILCHIAGGSLAMVAGVIALLATKGGRSHARAGMVFVWSYGLVIATAIFGLVLFEFRSFLAVATIASSYSLFSGVRAIRLRGRRPAVLDRVAAALGLAAPGIFLAAMHSLQKPWAPVLTWTVLGSLVVLSAYDLLRLTLPARWLEATWMHEHVFKIVGALDALVATFAATVLPKYQPWSALVPNLLGTMVIVFFFVAMSRAGTSRLPQRIQPPRRPGAAPWNAEDAPGRGAW